MGFERAVCKGCRQLVCGACGWRGRRKYTDENMKAPCPKCAGVGMQRYGVRHRMGVSCPLTRPRHRWYVCVWCKRSRRDDRMRKRDGEWECVNVHQCSRIVRRDA